MEDNFKEVKANLRKNFELLQVWFYENHMALNPGKCHYLTINKDIANESIELGKKTLHDEAEQKLFVKVIHKHLNFESNTNSIIKTANQKLSVFIRVATLTTDFNKKFRFNSLLKASLALQL